MADLAKYRRSLIAAGHDQLLECAAIDKELSDYDYDLLVQDVSKVVPPTRSSIKWVGAMRDRETARAEFYKDYA